MTTSFKLSCTEPDVDVYQTLQNLLCCVSFSVFG